jgi:FkbM family methyltransferase
MKMHILRRILHKTGFDIHRFKPGPDKLFWLKEMGIETILDIGANTGQFAIEIREILPKAFIYSFEPLQDCYHKLLHNMKDDKRFKAFNFALGNKNEKTTINRSSYSLSSSLLEMADSHKRFFPHTKDTWPEEISVKRLDDIEGLNRANVPKEILIKIDTQGFEKEVINGGIKFLQNTKIMIVETSYIPLYKDQPLFADIYLLLNKLGFSYGGALHQKLNPKTGQIIFEDSFFMRN